MVKNVWSRIVVGGLVFGAPRGELPVQTQTRLPRAFRDYTTHSSENRREQTGEAGGRLQDSRGEDPLESETWLSKCASVLERLSVIIPVLQTKKIK